MTYTAARLLPQFFFFPFIEQFFSVDIFIILLEKLFGLLKLKLSSLRR